MSRAKTAQDVLAQLGRSLADLETLDAVIASAHLDAAITALCRQFGLVRNSSKAD